MREGHNRREYAAKIGRGAARSRMARWLKYVLLALAVLTAVTPVYWMVTISLKSEVERFLAQVRVA